MKIGRKASKKINDTINSVKNHIWRTLIVAIIVLGVILIGRPLIKIIGQSRELRQLTKEKNLYKQNIYRDSLFIENLNNRDFLEQYAREKYFMKGKNEDVYLVE